MPMPPEIEPTVDCADISVIIPAYQAAATIERALASVRGQSLKPREILVVDDGSSDATFDLARGWVDRMEGMDLRVLRQRNMGAAAARNLALDQARCRYVAFLDADDEWLPEKLERSLARLKAGNARLVAHNGWTVRDGKEEYLDIALRFRKFAHAPFVGLYRKGFISTSSVVARRDCLMQAGGFDASLAVAHDFELWLNLLDRQDLAFEVFDQPLARYHITSNSLTSQTGLRLRCTLEIALRHAPALRNHPGSPLLSLWYRIAAVHWEAIRSFRNSGQTGLSLMAALQLPVNLTIFALRYLGTIQATRAKERRS